MVTACTVIFISYSVEKIGDINENKSFDIFFSDSLHHYSFVMQKHREKYKFIRIASRQRHSYIDFFRKTLYIERQRKKSKGC